MILLDLSVIDLAVATHRNGFACWLYSHVTAWLQCPRSLALVTLSRLIARWLIRRNQRSTWLIQDVCVPRTVVPTQLDGTWKGSLALGRLMRIQWSTQGPAQIVLESNVPGERQIYVMSIHDTNRRRGSSAGGTAVQPAWDPTGEHLAFSSTQGHEIGNY